MGSSLEDPVDLAAILIYTILLALIHTSTLKGYSIPKTAILRKDSLWPY